MTTRLLIPSLAALALTFAAAAAFAAGGDSGGGGGGGNSTTSPKDLKCKQGEVVKTVTENGKKVKKCVKAQSGILPDEELYQQGRLLAKAGEYAWALDVLAVIANQNDPRVLNYTGYSYRKQGQLDVGIGYYRKALTIDPNFVLAREYLGEGYVAAGRVDLARLELAEIGQRCGTSCEEYIDLSAAIAGKAED
jgi:tetratricopeptide (TPR) repeat protein